MYRKSSHYLRLVTLALTTIVLPAVAEGQNHSAKTATVLRAFASQPLSFEAGARTPAQGQSFFARGNGFGLYLNARDATFAFQRPAGDFRRDPGHAAMTEPELLRMRLAGGNRHSAPTALQPLPGKVSYFLGNDPKQWRTNLATFGRVRFPGVYPGIDLVYYGNQEELEYDFAVAPHADPSAIRLDFAGARGIEIDRAGALMVKMSHGAVRWNRPVVYQKIHGVRHTVDGRFVRKGATGVGFVVARYDASQPLVIDPILSNSSYFKGSGTDVARAMALDSLGNVYITGNTTSPNFPVTSKGALGINAGSGAYPDEDIFRTFIQGDAYILKLNPAGYVMQSAYVGGRRGASTAYGIAVDSDGNMFITGATNAGDFPVNKADQSFPSIEDQNDAEPRHTWDAFLYKLDPTFSTVVFSTRVGGKFTDIAYAVAIDTSGDAFITGTTNSPDLLRRNDNADPTKNNPGEHNHGFLADHTLRNAITGGFDAFVAGYDPSGNILYLTYYGGSGDDAGYGIAISSRGGARDQVYVTGKATAGIPLRNATNGTPSGNTDAFLAVFEYQGLGVTDTLGFGTYLGGSGDDRGMGIAIDDKQNVYVCGVTTSADFPTTNDAVQEFIGGSFENTTSGFSDGFLVKYGFGNPRYNTDGNITLPNLVQSYGTFIGGTFNDELRAVAVDSLHNVYVAGVSNSTNGFKSVATPLQIPYAQLDGNRDNGGIFGNFDFYPPPGGTDHDHNSKSFGVGWVGKITPDGALAYATNWAGSSHTALNAIAVDSATGNVFFAGETDSSDYPTTSDAYQPRSNGGKHVAFAKISPAIQKYRPYDLNQDGHQDLLFQKTTDGTVSYVLLNGSSIIGSSILFTAASTIPPFNDVPQPRAPVVATADLDGDGFLDVLYQDQSTGSLTYTLERANVDGYPGGTLAEPYYDGYIYTGLDKSWKLAAAVDLNGDGKPDLIFENNVTGALFTVLMDGVTPLYGIDPDTQLPTVFTATILNQADLGWQVVGTPDITGGGHPDIVFQYTNGDVYYAPTGNGGNGIFLDFPGNFSDNYLIRNMDPNFKVKGFIDINGDGIPDIILQNQSTGDIVYGLMGRPVGGRAVPPKVYGYIARGVDVRQQIVGIH